MKAWLERIHKLVAGLPASDQVHLMPLLFEHCNISTPKDFLKMALNKSRHLQRCTGPMLLMDSQRGLAACERMRVTRDCLQDGCPLEYWNTPSMLCTPILEICGQNLHNGPMCAVTSLGQETSSPKTSRSHIPMEVCCRYYENV